MLFNFLLVFVILFIISFILINPSKKKEDIKPKAEYLITMTWPDDNPNDIDIWVRDPIENVIWYNHKEAGVMYLDRDDLGYLNDEYRVNGQTIYILRNIEVVTLRGRMTGKWTVNVQFYGYHTFPGKTEDHNPVTVKVEMVSLNPFKIIFTKDVVLAHPDDEKTVYSFMMNDDGNIFDLDDAQIPLVPTVDRTSPEYNPGPTPDGDATPY